MYERSSRRQAAKFSHPNRLSVHRNHLLLVVAISLLFGVLCAPSVQEGIWPIGLLALSIPLGFTLQKLGLRPYAAVALLFFAIGLYNAQTRLHPSLPQEGRYSIHATVYGEPTLRTDQRMTFLLCDVLLDGQSQPGKSYCTLYTYDGAPLPLLYDGAELSFEGSVYHPSGKSGPYDFDFRMWLLGDGIAYGISTYASPQILNTPETAQWTDVASRVRGIFGAALTRVMGDEARLAMAMLFSDREGMAVDERSAFETLGIAHVMSVSGLHVGILGACLLWLLRKCRMRSAWQLPVLAVFLFGYCALTGFSAASVRAAVMLLLYQVGRSKGLIPDPLLMLSAAMIFVLLTDPLQLFSAGFVLSFSAMAGILLLRPPLVSLLMGRVKPSESPFAKPLQNQKGYQIRKRFSDALAFSLAAQLGVFLPTAAYFHRLPLYGVFINVPIVPLVGLLVPLYMAVLLLSPVPLLGAILGLIAKWASALLLWLVELLATLPYASIPVATAPTAMMCAAVFCAVFISLYFRHGLRKRLAAIFLSLCIALCGVWFTRPAEVRYVQLSVGREDSALITDGPYTLAIDTGSYGTELASYLLAEGRDLDALFLTHLHFDHIGGVQALLEEGISIGRVYLPVGADRQQVSEFTLQSLEALKAAGIPILELAAGDELRYNKVSISVCWPRRETLRYGQDANDLPLVLSVDLDGYTVLAASDLTGSYEAYAASPCDVLKVAHHGSADSTFPTFLDWVQPAVALISCQRKDASLPAPATLQRLAEADCTVLRTDSGGDITLSVTDGLLSITTYKTEDAD